MNDQPGPTSPTPQEEQVRRLLASARHDEPVPPDVADRLDLTLAELAVERSAASTRTVTPVSDLAARRRRRKAGQLLLAAAAVVVAGVSVGQVISDGSGSDSDAGGASTSESLDRGAGDGSGVAADAEAAESAPGPAASSALAAVVPLELTSANLERGLENQLRRLPVDLQRQLTDAGKAYETAPPSLLDQAPGFTCPAVDAASVVGNLVPATYDGTSVVVSVTTDADGGLRGDVLDCTTGAELASVPIELR